MGKRPRAAGREIPALILCREGTAGWRAAADSVLRAMHAAAPFNMPAGYEQQELAFSFRTASMCGNR